MSRRTRFRLDLGRLARCGPTGDRQLTVKERLLVAAPPSVVTAIRPVVAPGGTTTRRWLPPPRRMVAGAPLKVTDCTLNRSAPFSVIFVPGGPLRGEKSVRVGGAA